MRTATQKEWLRHGSLGPKKVMSNSWSSNSLPSLCSNNHRITSPAKNRYNCVAWAAGSETKWWWPENKGYWPEGAPRAVTLDAFLSAFATLGYEKCEAGSLEEGYEKISIFAQDHVGRLRPTHAAKQLRNGWWTSKLGPLEDIEHKKVEDVSGPCYGEPVVFMRRLVTE